MIASFGDSNTKDFFELGKVKYILRKFGIKHLDN
jgi:hypothetical protein